MLKYTLLFKVHPLAGDWYFDEVEFIVDPTTEDIDEIVAEYLQDYAGDKCCEGEFEELKVVSW